MDSAQDLTGAISSLPDADMKAAMRREQRAFERRRDAFARARRLLFIEGPDDPVRESLKQARAADGEWRSAIAEVERLCLVALHGN